MGQATRVALVVIALIGLFGTNGVFLYHFFFDHSVVAAALHNPVALAFIIEALAVTALIAWVMGRRGGRPGWLAFVGLSLMGGLLFSIPAYLLLMKEKDG